MEKFERPKLIVSRCIEHEKCRYNGLQIGSPLVASLKPICEMITPCPEVQIGLGIPREAVRLVQEKDSIRLQQSMSGGDVTTKMEQFCQNFSDSIDEIDGMILKSRSPSCGIKDVKIYKTIGKVAPISSKGIGIFAKHVKNHFPLVALEDEGRLTNFRIREHFLTRIFLHARYRKVKKEANMKALIDFHSQNKYLMMAYNQTEIKQAGKLVANHEKKDIDTILNLYEEKLAKIFDHIARVPSTVNVLMHLLGYFSKLLSAKEKAFFLDQLQRYRHHKLPLIAISTIIQAWMKRDENAYLENQTFFQPYPLDLMNISDSGKGRLA